jgi:hypothetical protein
VKLQSQFSESSFNCLQKRSKTPIPYTKGGYSRRSRGAAVVDRYPSWQIFKIGRATVYNVYNGLKRKAACALKCAQMDSMGLAAKKDSRRATFLKPFSMAGVCISED